MIRQIVWFYEMHRVPATICADLSKSTIPLDDTVHFDYLIWNKLPLDEELFPTTRVFSNPFRERPD